MVNAFLRFWMPPLVHTSETEALQCTEGETFDWQATQILEERGRISRIQHSDF